jgi:hypothetical protein
VRLIVLFSLAACVMRAQDPLQRALKYLSGEVPQWHTKNGCFSCHNNGDGARALYAAGLFQPVRSTTQWLTSPADWDKTGTDVSWSDKKLARYQFAAALTSAVDAGAVQNREALNTAARDLASLQSADGSWRVEDAGDAPGSPVTWGTTLATYFGRRTLQAAGGHEDAVRRSETWLRAAQLRHTPDQAAVLLAFPDDDGIRKRAVERFAQMQTSDGGWGPRLHAPAEVFDTAIVLLALRAAGEKTLLQRGREFLIRTQQPFGGWPETTRPPGSQSYAQHISTTAWATLALLATDTERK